MHERHAAELSAAQASMRESEMSTLAEFKESQLLADRAAFGAINHCAKRVMYNTMHWCDILQRKTMHELATAGIPEDDQALSDLKDIVEVIQSDSEKGFKKCKSVLVQQQIASGTYQCDEQPHEILVCLSHWRKLPNFTLEVSPEVPAWLLLPWALVEIILDNCVHNATTHGCAGGPLIMKLCVVNGRTILTLVNLPGCQHAKALQLQEQYGRNFLFTSRPKENRLNISHIGSTQSTFLGMNEMLQAANLMDANISLTFEDTRVVFMLSWECKPCSPAAVIPETEMVLPEGSILICADDDAAPRLSYKGLAKKLGIPTKLIVFGETYESAMAVTDVVLQKSKEENQTETLVIVILDQNMEYDEGHVLGTEITANLRNAGFKGLIFIRSANDSPADVKAYLIAGADACLSKAGNVKELAADLVKKTDIAWSVRM